MKWQNYVQFWWKFRKIQVLSLIYKKTGSKILESKFHVKSEPIICILFFEKFGFMSSSSMIFCLSKFSKITKNWVEDTITISVKKKVALNLKMWKVHSVETLSFINSLQNTQSRFLIYLECKWSFFWHQFYVRFLLKMNVLVHTF